MIKNELWDSISHMRVEAFADVWIDQHGRIHYGIPQIKFQNRRNGYRRRYFRVNENVLLSVDVHSCITITLNQVATLISRHFAINAMIDFINEETYVRKNWT